jgi:flagellar biosynthesis protein FlhG
MNRVSLKRSPETALPLVSILSGKGGVGKSVLAANLAHAISLRGIRTLVVDFDLHCGNLHILLNQSANTGLPDVLAGKAQLRDVILSLSPTLSMIPSTAPLADAHRREAGEQVIALLKTVSAQFDIIIIDHPSGMSLSSLFVAESSRLNVVVAIPDLTSISDAFGVCKHLTVRRSSGTLALLINRCLDDLEADDINEKFRNISERFLKRSPEPIGFIRELAEIRQSVASQSPISSVASDSEANQSIIRLANQVLDLTTASTLALYMGVDSFGNELHKTPATADIKD